MESNTPFAPSSPIVAFLVCRMMRCVLALVVRDVCMEAYSRLKLTGGSFRSACSIKSFLPRFQSSHGASHCSIVSYTAMSAVECFVHCAALRCTRYGQIRKHPTQIHAGNRYRLLLICVFFTTLKCAHPICTKKIRRCSAVRPVPTHLDPRRFSVEQLYSPVC